MELNLEHVTKSYNKGVKALDDFSMHFTPGVYGLLGPNGAGKSTLLNIVTDNLKPTEGNVYFDGKPIHEAGESYRNVLGYMPQQQSLYDNFTGEEFLWYMASLKGLPKKMAGPRIKELLELVNLKNAGSKKIGSYSGGMKQRILIAQALLNDPKLLVMDEPTAGLDPTERIRIRNLLSTISEDKIIIVATHLVSDIEFIAKQVILIKNGKILKANMPQELLKDLDGKVYEVELPFEQEISSEKIKIANIRMGIRGKIYRIISDQPTEYKEQKTVNPSLEDLYLYYLG